MHSLHSNSSYILIVLFLILNYSNAQQAGNTSLLSGFWNSLTSVEQVSTCPGECVHTLTSIFCDQVLENVTCGDSYFRCCVMNPVSSNLGQIVPESTVTSATTTITSMFDPDAQDSVSTQTTDKNQASFEASNTESSSEIVPTLKPEVGNVSTVQHCPVECSKIPENSFCVKSISNVQCPRGEGECCLEIESSIDTMTRNLIKLVQETVARNESRNIGHELVALAEGNTNLTSRTNSHSTHLTSTTTTEVFGSDLVGNSPKSPASTESSLPPCSGTCVVSLFSILCDSTDDQQFCPNGGTCCVNREMTTPAPVIGPCQGTCMPVILSGMCNKPYELVLKTTDCSSSTICCADKKNDFGEDSTMDESSKAPEIDSQLSPQNPRLPNRPVRPHHPYPVLWPGSPHLGHRPKPHPSDDTISRIPQQDAPPLFSCPGSCMSTMFRFACLGQNSIYPAFYCSKGQVCCAPNSEIEKFEAFIQAQLAQQIAQQQKPQSKPTMKPIAQPNIYPHHPHQPPPQQPPSLPPSQIPSSILKPPEVIQDLPQIIDQPVDVISSQDSTMTPHICGIKGSRRSSRVVGGSDSFPGEWCWQVALVNQHNKYICGGILIDKQWVLTAAHCITGLLRKNEKFFVHVGQFDLTRQNRPPFKVASTFIHHNHNTQSLDNDIALLKLSSPAELSSDTCLVCLPTKANKRDPGKRCIVTGYGYQHEAGPMALRVRQATVPIVEDNECTSKINKVTERIFTLPASSFCAGGEGGNDACQGDGGSGLVCEDDGYYELAGLVSWGFGCGRPDVPGVYVKVSSFVGWINQIVSINNQ